MSRVPPFVREITPPILFRLAKSVVRTMRSPSKKTAVGGIEKGADYYDETFEAADHWKNHYTKSHYYPLWTVVADRIKSRGKTKILDIGCGPGQVACVMGDTEQVDDYLGLDFSNKRIAQAQRVCPKFKFLQADVFTSDVLDNHDYDTVLLMEFLEHIDQDLEVLQRVKKGVYILATVPNFDAPGHVRYFGSVKEVEQRYQDHISDIRVDEILANDKGIKYFIIEGHKRRT